MIVYLKKYILKLALLAAFLFTLASGASAQGCAMCKAVAEDAVQEGGWGIAFGLNEGILFIMSMPYILLAILFIVFFRTRILGFVKAFNNIHR